MIETLDKYVWEHAAKQQREWKDRLGAILPVSVNIPRVDMYNPHLIDIFKKILAEFDLQSSELLLEITESAYTERPEQLIETTQKLRDLGFMIEMDDFGSGYSSLSMIASLPLDVLKLDMSFVRNASKQQNTKLLEVMVDIADYLSVPTIAEGVETEEQMNMLKDVGCDIVQGYYFSKPVPASEYEKFLTEYIGRIK